MSRGNLGEELEQGVFPEAFEAFPTANEAATINKGRLFGAGPAKPADGARTGIRQGGRFFDYVAGIWYKQNGTGASANFDPWLGDAGNEGCEVARWFAHILPATTFQEGDLGGRYMFTNGLLRVPHAAQLGYTVYAPLDIDIRISHDNCATWESVLEGGYHIVIPQNANVFEANPEPPRMKNPVVLAGDYLTAILVSGVDAYCHDLTVGIEIVRT